MSGGLLSCTTGRTLEIDTEVSPAIENRSVCHSLTNDCISTDMPRCSFGVATRANLY